MPFQAFSRWTPGHSRFNAELAGIYQHDAQNLRQYPLPYTRYFRKVLRNSGKLLKHATQEHLERSLYMAMQLAPDITKPEAVEWINIIDDCIREDCMCSYNTGRQESEIFMMALVHFVTKLFKHITTPTKSRSIEIALRNGTVVEVGSDIRYFRAQRHRQCMYENPIQLVNRFWAIIMPQYYQAIEDYKSVRKVGDVLLDLIQHIRSSHADDHWLQDHLARCYAQVASRLPIQDFWIKKYEKQLLKLVNVLPPASPDTLSIGWYESEYGFNAMMPTIFSADHPSVLRDPYGDNVYDDSYPSYSRLRDHDDDYEYYDEYH